MFSKRFKLQIPVLQNFRNVSSLLYSSEDSKSIKIFLELGIEFIKMKEVEEASMAFKEWKFFKSLNSLKEVRNIFQFGHMNQSFEYAYILNK